MLMDYRIAVVGIGGVGGVLAAQLLKAYGESVSLVARGARREALKKDGLTLHSDYFGDYNVKTDKIVEKPADLGEEQDVILVCVKNGALEQVAEQIAPVVGENTVIMPVMNGVSAAEILRQKLGKGTVLDTVIYTVSSAGADYTITQKGNYTYLVTGEVEGDPWSAACAYQMSNLFKGAGVECRLAEDARAAVWKKYVLNCAYNVATARWGCNVGALKADAQRREDCRALMTEACAVAAAKGVKLQEDLVERHMVTIMEKTTPESDSSLSRDFDAGRVGEMDVFSGYLVREAERLGVDAPVSKAYFEALQERAAGFGKG